MKYYKWFIQIRFTIIPLVTMFIDSAVSAQVLYSWWAYTIWGLMIIQFPTDVLWATSIPSFIQYLTGPTAFIWGKHDLKHKCKCWHCNFVKILSSNSWTPKILSPDPWKYWLWLGIYLTTKRGGKIGGHSMCFKGKTHLFPFLSFFNPLLPMYSLTE